MPTITTLLGALSRSLPTRTRTVRARGSILLACVATVGVGATAGCLDRADDEDGMVVACRAQAYRYSEYTGGARRCTCFDDAFSESEDPSAVCQQLYDDLFSAGYSAGGGHDTEYSFVVAAPGLSCDEIDIDPCDNASY